MTGPRTSRERNNASAATRHDGEYRRQGWRPTSGAPPSSAASTPEPRRETQATASSGPPNVVEGRPIADELMSNRAPREAILVPPLAHRVSRGLARRFRCVLGNPPWERVKLQEKEFFAARSPEIATAPNKAARERLIRALKPLIPMAVVASCSLRSKRPSAGQRVPAT